MNELDTRDRRGAHRLQRGPLRSVLPGLLAVAAVAALVVAVLVMRGTAPRDATVAATSTPASTATTSAPATTSASPSGAATSTPTGAAQTPQGTPASPTDSSAATPTAPADVKGSTQVVVLNQTRISGLAGRLAATLRGAGWTVARTGNFSGNVPATTVYYPEGMQAAAQALAADVPGPDRVRPRFGNLATDKLTVVVTSAG